MRVRLNRLPAGYIEVEYISSTGTQYINPNYKFTSNVVDITATFSSKKSGKEMVIAGSSSYIEIAYSSSVGRIFAYSSGKTTLSYTNRSELYDGKPHKLHFWQTSTTKYFQYDKLDAISNTSLAGVSGYNVYVMAYNPSNMNYSWEGKIYSCTIKDNGVLVRNLVPCIKVATSEAGMFDTVNSVFYANAGTGTFGYGKVANTGRINIPVRIPLDYQEVEYIQSTGTQRIKLDIQPTSKYKIEETFAITDKTVTSALWCARGTNTGNNSTTAFHIANSQIRCDYGVSASMTNIGAINKDQKYTLTMDANKWYLDGVLKTTATAANFTAGSKIQLFCSHYNGIDANLGNYSRMKLYSFKVWNENGELVGSFVPCYRRSDNVIGLYDIASDHFYINNGTGTFLKGNNISSIIPGIVPGGSSGILYGYNQLIALTAKTNNNGVTWMPNRDGSFSLSGTATGIYSSWAEALLDDHKYLVKIEILENPNNVTISVGFLNVSGGSTSSISSGSASKLVTYTAGSGKSYGIVYPSQSVLDGVKIRLTCIDLTNWYGSGKEPATVAAFEEKFPNDYYGTARVVIKLTENQINALPLYGYNQLIQNGNFANGTSSWSKSGGTSYSAADGIMTLTAVSLGTYDFAIYQNIGNLTANHKYLMMFDAKTNSASTKQIGIYTSGGWVVSSLNLAPSIWNPVEKIFSYGTDKSSVIAYFGLIGSLSGRWTNGDILYFRNINIIDLTEWYGAGNEPATVTEFKETFGKLYYKYSKLTCLNAIMINLQLM